jgi:phosphohistidine phosphatase
MIYLMRHSQATPADFRTTDDARWLTAKGRTMASAAGKALAQEVAAGPIDMIVTSPLSRTTQTAELVAQALGWNAEIVCLESLRSESSPHRAIEELEALGAVAVLAVTHEPIVSSMYALLSGQKVRDIQSGFRPAEIACLHEGKVGWRYRD